MAAYPLELRERIIAAVDGQKGTIAQIAELFQVTERFIYKLLAQRRDTGDLAPLPHGGGAEAKLGTPQLLQLAELVAEFPEATLDELRQLLQRRARVKVGVTTVWRALRVIDLTVKKRPGVPARRARKSALRSGASN